MSLTLHYHPLASFCWKVLVGLYENATPFEGVIVDLGDEASRTAFYRIAPFGKFPVIEDRARGETVAETSVILDYLDLHHPGPVRFVPADPDQAWRVRLWDRLFDNYVQLPMQAIVADRIRSDGSSDPYAVAVARDQLARSYAWMEGEIGTGWVCGDFGLADCAAAPALFYADKVQPLGEAHPKLTAYLERLKARPSFARVLKEAEPYFHMFPAG